MSTASENTTGGESGRRLSRSQRAAQILLAAEALLTERGFDQVSMRDIASRAGLKKALVFYYFGSREELFHKLLERYGEAHSKALSLARDAGESARERLRRLLERYMDFVDTHPTFARLVLQEVSRHGESQIPEIRNSLSALRAAFHDSLGSALPEKGPFGPTHFFATLSAAIYNYASFQRVLGETSATDEGRSERREHVLWLGEVMLSNLPTAGH
jgi:AcrR family transcriptional regulator